MSMKGKTTNKKTNHYLGDLPNIVKQLEFCGYECEAGCLKNNVAFLALQEIAEQNTFQNSLRDTVSGLIDKYACYIGNEQVSEFRSELRAALIEYS